MRPRFIFLLYIAVGVLVAAGVIGSDDSYFSDLSDLEEFAEMVLAVVLWPLVLLDVNVNIGDINIGGGDSGGGGSGGDGSEGAADAGSGGSGDGGADAAGGGGGGK